MVNYKFYKNYIEQVTERNIWGVGDKVTKITSDFTHAVYMRLTTRPWKSVSYGRASTMFLRSLLFSAVPKFFSAVVTTAMFTDAAVTDILEL